MSPAGRSTGAIGIAESLETYPVRIMRRPLHSALTVLSCSGLHAAFEVFGVGACEVAASGLGYRRGREVVMKRFTFTVGFVGFLLLLVAFPLHAQQAEVTRNVNLRADPSADNPPIRLLMPPEQVQLLEPSETTLARVAREWRGEFIGVRYLSGRRCQVRKRRCDAPSSSR